VNKIENSKAPILITGGAGYLGSHMAAFCLEKNQDVVILDNLSNSDLSNLQTLEAYFKRPIPFFKIDLLDKNKLEDLFARYQFSSVIHFAGLKSVAESVDNPELYFENNVQGSQYLINCIKTYRIKKVVFSSSATVYGQPIYLPIDEAHPIQPTNPYGETKAEIEKLFMNDSYFLNNSAHLLRYFNPVGSYKKIIFEKPNGRPNNLMPFMLGVVNGKYRHLNIFGDDYDTDDGTGVRDYIHVMDLVEAHWKSLDHKFSGCHVYNVGCGNGYSVKQLVQAYEKINKVTIPYQIKPRRPGDVSISYADVNKIKQDLNWTARYGLNDMCKDSFYKN